jgi:hypothetical protein
MCASARCARALQYVDTVLVTLTSGWGEVTQELSKQ